MVAILVFSCVVVGIVACTRASAISSNVVISQVQVGDVNSSRLIELFNNSENDVDTTGWCVYRSSASNATLTTIGCLTDSNPAVHILFPSKTHMLFATSLFFVNFDMPISVTLGNGTSGHVYVKDNEKQEIDRVGWGINNSIDPDYPKNAEGNPVSLGVNKVIERRTSEELGKLIDTDDNANDFIQSSLRTEYESGALYDIEDVCVNITGIQVIVPEGYVIDTLGDCTLPVVDICINLPDVQPSLPADYKLDNAGNCTLNLLPLRITELLPNPEGSDDDSEYVEIYNPNDSDVDLTYYVFYLGDNDAHFYSFPASEVIPAGEYRVFYSSAINFTLVNATGSLRLKSADNFLIDEAPTYIDAGDDMAWALINGTWQYTNRPTPGAANYASVLPEVDEPEGESSLKPCAPNQYRNPETNRCKLIVSAGSTLVPCKDGQYRSEITNRCRSIASDAALQSCGPGQYRNPETNRCKSILGATSTLTPCAIGEERNPETNRCRKIGSSLVPSAPFAVEPIAMAQGNYIDTWVLGGVGLVAVAYGLWEWRVEFRNVFRKVVRAFRKDKA